MSGVEKLLISAIVVILVAALGFALLAGCDVGTRRTPAPVSVPSTDTTRGMALGTVVSVLPGAQATAFIYVDNPTHTATATPTPNGRATQQAYAQLAATATRQMREWGVTATSYVVTVRAYYAQATTVLRTTATAQARAAAAENTQQARAFVAETTQQARAAIADGTVEARGVLPESTASAQGFLPGPGGTFTYLVQTRDTMYSIARRFGVTVEALAAANGISNLWHIEVGRVMVIPGGVIRPPGPAPVPVPVPMPGPRYHCIAPGETLYSIARLYAVPVPVLIAANGIVDPDHILVGQRLLIPSPQPVPIPVPVPIGPQPPYPDIPGLPPLPEPPVWPFETPFPPYPEPPFYTPLPPIYPTLYPTFEISPPPPSSDRTLYRSPDGEFSLQYPTAWQRHEESLSGYHVFWARESNDPFSPGIAVISKPVSGFRPAREVLDSYKSVLPSLMSGKLGGATFSWDNRPEATNIGGVLGQTDHGSARIAGTDRARLQALAAGSDTYEYLVLVWAPPGQWGANQSLLQDLIGNVKSFAA